MTTIKGYTLVEPPLQGGMAVVYKGKNGNFTRAFKIVRPDKAANAPRLSQQFLKEIQLQSQLDHRNIVKILEAYAHTDEKGNTFTVLEMEWLNGMDLERYVEQRAEFGMKSENIKKIALQVIDGLEYAHLQNILHLDVKPSNLFRTIDESIKIIDFGIARVVGENASMMEGVEKLTLTTESGESTFRGTLAYASPEQQVGGKLGFYSDIYSFGKTLHFLATASTDPSVEVKTEWLAKIIDKCTLPNPKHRYQNFKEVREAFIHPDGEIKKCPNCDSQIATTAKFCEFCGSNVTVNEQKEKCSNCGTERENNAIFCSNCGNNFEKAKEVEKKWKCNHCFERWTDPEIDSKTSRCCFCGSRSIVLDL